MLRGVGRPTGGLDAELLCILGVQSLPAAELHGLGADDASDRLTREEPVKDVEANVPARGAPRDEAAIDVVPERQARAAAERLEFPPQVAATPAVLEYSWGGNDLRWELEPLGSGTRLTLWHNIDRRFISWGAAGWHICFDVLDRLLAGEPIGRIVGPEAMKFGGWQRLNAEYAKQFGVETPGWPPSPER